MFLQSLLGTFNPCPVTLLSLLSVLNPVSSPHPPPLLLPFCLQVGWQRLLALRGAQVEELCLLLSIFSVFFSPFACLLTHLVSSRLLSALSVLRPLCLPSPPTPLLFSLPWQWARCDVLIRFVDLTGISSCLCGASEMSLFKRLWTGPGCPRLIYRNKDHQVWLTMSYSGKLPIGWVWLAPPRTCISEIV